MSRWKGIGRVAGISLMTGIALFVALVAILTGQYAANQSAKNSAPDKIMLPDYRGQAYEEPVHTVCDNGKTVISQFEFKGRAGWYQIAELKTESDVFVDYHLNGDKEQFMRRDVKIGELTEFLSVKEFNAKIAALSPDIAKGMRGEPSGCKATP